jgi:hypothetical protein
LATVTLSAPAREAGVVVTLSSSDPAATVPSSVSIDGGAASGTFTVSTGAVALAVDAMIRGTTGSTTRDATLGILPGTSVRLASIAISASSVEGGREALGSITLNAPAAVDVDVTVSSSHGAALVPRSVRVAAGSTAATFPVSTLAVVFRTEVAIEATLGSESVATVLTILPPPLQTFFAYASEPGDFIGLGQSGRLAPPAHLIKADALCSGNWLYSSVAGWTIEFSAPAGEPLRPGTYGSPGPIRDRLRPGLRVSGNAHACQSVTGHFTITDAVFSASGDVERFRATFEQHCDAAGPALTGELSLSSVPRANRQTLCIQ